jgi:hypothetical protein
MDGALVDDDGSLGVRPYTFLEKKKRKVAF